MYCIVLAIRVELSRSNIRQWNTHRVVDV